jgi:hypothetical protein
MTPDDRPLVSQQIFGDRNVQVQCVAEGGSVVVGAPPAFPPLEPAIAPVGPDVTSPARLIKARAGVIPFVARRALADRIQEALSHGAAFGGCIIGGHGGIGKTHLGVELCQRAIGDGWDAGLLTPALDSTSLGMLLATRTRRLVIVDYAETRRNELETLLPRLAQTATETSPVRVVLLVRTRPRRSSDWSGFLRTGHEGLDSILDGLPVHALGDTPLSLAERRDVLERTVEALANYLPEPNALSAPPSDLSSDAFADPLMLVIAAYLSHQGTRPPETRAALLDQIVLHEQHYWQRHLEQTGLSVNRRLQQKIIATATLTRPNDEHHASEFLQHLTEMSDSPKERLYALVRWSADLYPDGPGPFWNPLEPDLVGEHLVVRALTDVPTLLTRTLAEPSEGSLTRSLEVYGRAAGNNDQLALALAETLSDCLPRLLGVATAQISGDSDSQGRRSDRQSLPRSNSRCRTSA